MILEEYKCTIPTSPLVVAALKKSHMEAEQNPLINISIGFTEGVFKLCGDWQYMMAANKNNEPVWSTYNRERVMIETDIYPALPINLDDADSDGLLFSLQGSIADDHMISSCSGLLVVDKGPASDQWSISFYLYDHRFEDCEISFKLPVYVSNRSHKN